MRFGIDISQTAHRGGVPNYLYNLVYQLLKQDAKNEYILFFSSLRGNIPSHIQSLTKEFPNVTIKQFKLPPSLLHVLWNIFHIAPIEWFIGKVDVFLSSDWVEPPTLFAKKITILYDLVVYKYPEEANNKTSFSLKSLLLTPNIVSTQKRKHYWMKKEVEKILCISEATKKDVMELLGIPESKLKVIFAGVNL